MTARGADRAASCASPECDAALTAALLAVDPVGLGGAVLRGSPGPLRDAWLALLHAGLRPESPWRRLPPDAPDSRVLGGLDLTATLRAGRPVAERGVLADCDGGVVVLPMAERIGTDLAARLAAVLDTRDVSVQRDGLAMRWPAALSLVALDEGVGEEERAPERLCERLAFSVRLEDLPRGTRFGGADAPDLSGARARLDAVEVGEDILHAVCATGLALGIASPRAALLAIRVARASAALAGRSAATEEDAALAARLVLAHRATRLPAEQPDDAPPPDPTPERERESQADSTRGGDDAMDDVVLAAARAALPPMLLAALGAEAREAARHQASAQGRSGAQRREGKRGRPIGVRAGRLKSGARLALVETLRAAAPWQRVRQAPQGGGAAIRVRPEDIRLRRYREPTGTTAIFAVDASGSAALHRLAEVKGAIELLLADCYARRDRVALIAFRGRAAEILLPPTHALARARRSLAGLPGGGPTPLASALDAAHALALSERRQGRQPLLVLLTDGRANVARDGRTGRGVAEEDALGAARLLQAARLPSLLVDTAPRPVPYARTLATAMGARHLALPQADATGLSALVGAAARAA